MTTIAVAIPTIPPRAELLQRALASVQAQTRLPDQIIVQYDHDGLGAAPTRNRAWQAATSEYVAFLDDDDEFYPHHLEVLLRVAEAQGADFVYSWFDLYNAQGQHVKDPLAVPNEQGDLVCPLGIPWSDRLAEHMRDYAFIPITRLCRRSMLENSGGFPIPGTIAWEMQDCEDWGGALAMLDAGAKFAHAPHVTWRCNLGVGIGGRPWR